jgi:hypothetical protein
MRQNLAELHSRPAGDDLRLFSGRGQPSNVFAARHEIAEPVPRFRAQDLERH